MMFRSASYALAVSVFLTASAGCANEVTLQYYESRWETIEKKMADIFVAGYSSLWLPPPGKADTGGYSVGYDVFDRFNLGKPFDQTLYGTESSAKQLVDTAHTAGLKVYFDYIMNHNGFRDASTPGFVSSCDYPGFVVTLPTDVDGDFHGAYDNGDQLRRLSGLIDIAQEKNHEFIRQPADFGPQNIPGESPQAVNRQFYPDLSLPPNSFGIYPFNTASPLAGDPVPENATGLLLRNAQWMIESIGADGFRMDAVKHVPPFFFNDFFDKTMFQRGRPNLAGSPTTPFTFGEALTGDFSILGQYRRRDSFANREVLDFPLFFILRDVLGGAGLGDMRQLEFGSVDAIDGNANDGSAGVTFAQSHDDFGPSLENVAYAHILTRAGLPIVYHNALEFGAGRDFPKQGRGDALGGTGAVIPKLVDVSRRYAKGLHRTRSIDNDVYVYERANSLLVGLSDRGDAGYDERTVFTDFRSVTLSELTGAAADPVINANGDIPATITVDVNGATTIRVPRNKTDTTTHNRGYVMYGLAPPSHTHAVSPIAATLPADAPDVPQAQRRLTPLPVVTQNSFTISVQTTAVVPEDNALVRLDAGVDIDDQPGLAFTSGEFAGFETFSGASSPRAGGGTGKYSVAIDTTSLTEGLHFIETLAFLPRPTGSPSVYSSVRSALYLDRVAPPVQLTQPSHTGSNDVQSQSYPVIVNSSDMTADSMHVFFDKPAGYDYAANISDGNKMLRVDRGEFRYDWNNITAGTHNITILAFEPTGRSSVTRFENIAATLPQPPIGFGVDVDNSSTAVNFQPMPSTIINRAYPNEVVVRVDRGTGLTYPTDYSLSLEIDGLTFPAEVYSADKLPPVNRLVQNDQNPSDAFDEFRYLWQGYSHGPHSLIARAQLAAGNAPPNSIPATVTVHSGITGPPVTILNPQSGQTFDQPASLTMDIATDATAESLQLFISQPGSTGPFQLLESINSPASTILHAEYPAGSYQLSDSFTGLNLFNGIYTLKAVAATGLNGSGIRSENNTTISVTGFAEPLESNQPVLDSDISDFFDRIPLAVSAADGAGNSPTVADFGSDGSLTELHARIYENTLYLAVRGDMFSEVQPNANAIIIYIDVDTAATGARQMHTTSDLADSGTQLRHLVRNSGFTLNSALQASGVGFDAAVIVDGTAPTSAKVFGFGTGGVSGSPSNFEELPATIYFGRGLHGYPGAPGTSIAAPSGFETAIPLQHLGNPNPRNMAFAVVTTSETSFPSPNSLPENTQNTFDGLQTLTSIAKFPVYPPIILNEIFNGDQDFVELTNPGDLAVQLDQWFLKWADLNGASALLPLTGVTISSGINYSLVYDSQGPSPTPTGSLKLSHNIPWHPGRAASAALVDPYGIAVDYVRWKSTTGQAFGELPPAGTTFTGDALSPDGLHNRSLARSATSVDTDAAADWVVQLSTPGAQNPDTASVRDWMLLN